MAISRGFSGRRHTDVDPARVPPGQYVTGDFPVLSAGPTPHTPLGEWTFEIRGAVDEPVSWSWDELLALPSETPTVDIQLRDQVVQARDDLARRLRRTASGLVELGHDPSRIRTERFGPTGA